MIKSFKEFTALNEKIREFRTYQAWKKAIKDIDKNAKFEGDKDIDGAHKKGWYEADWDGEKGRLECFYTNESDYYKITQGDMQNIWKETDISKKKEKALSLIDKLSGKGKVDIIKIIDKIKSAVKGDMIDKIMANIMLSGSGLKVINEAINPDEIHAEIKDYSIEDGIFEVTFSFTDPKESDYTDTWPVDDIIYKETKDYINIHTDIYDLDLNLKITPKSKKMLKDIKDAQAEIAHMVKIGKEYEAKKQGK